MSHRPRNVSRKLNFARSGPPAKIRVVLGANFELSAASSASYAQTTLKANSPRDFAGTLSTASAIYWSFYASIYRYYRVTASKIFVKTRLSSTSGTPTATAMHADIAVAPALSGATFSAISNLASNKFAKTGTAGGEQVNTITSQVTMKQLAGNAFNNSDTYRVNITSDPAALYNWYIGYQSRGYTNVNLEIDCQLWYMVEFSELEPGALPGVARYHELAYRANCYVVIADQEDRKKEQKATEEKMAREKLEFNELSKQLNVLLTEPDLVTVPDPPSARGLIGKLETKKNFFK
jgi:hypothetical protein